MRIGLIAEKLGMSRFFDSSGINHPATLLKVDKCKIVGVLTDEKNGYNALRLSFGESKKNTKVSRGFLKKNNLSGYRKSKEFRVKNTNDYKIGDEINVSNFTVGQYVDVSSKSIGKGFAGGMKRHNFGGNRATHGVSISHRSHGSTGQCQDPGKVFKGKKMAGHLGDRNVTIQNLKVLKIDKENNLILVKGSVPGHKGSLINIVDSIKKDFSKLKNTVDTNILADRNNSNQESKSDKPAEETQVVEPEKVKKAAELDAEDQSNVEKINSNENGETPKKNDIPPTKNGNK